MKKRLPFLILLGLGFVLWRSGFGFLASERTITWRLPLQYADVRRLEVQIWDQDSLLGRQEFTSPAGLTSEPELKLPLKRGQHRAVASVWLADAGTASFQQGFDPGSDTSLVIELSRPR